MGAMQIQPSWPEDLLFGSSYMYSFSERVRDSISIEYNRGWIVGVMNSGFIVVDIGRSINRRNNPISVWYKVELQVIGRARYPNLE